MKTGRSFHACVSLSFASGSSALEGCSPIHPLTFLSAAKNSRWHCLFCISWSPEAYLDFDQTLRNTTAIWPCITCVRLGKSLFSALDLLHRLIQYFGTVLYSQDFFFFLMIFFYPSQFPSRPHPFLTNMHSTFSGVILTLIFY